MANIHSQKKRILRAERERLENRRYTSRVKTLFRRLETAVAAGDDAAADTEHRTLVQIDRQGRQGRRAAPQHRRAQEVARRPATPRRLQLAAGHYLSFADTRMRPLPGWFVVQAIARDRGFRRRSGAARAAPRCPR